MPACGGISTWRGLGLELPALWRTSRREGYKLLSNASDLFCGAGRDYGSLRCQLID